VPETKIKGCWNWAGSLKRRPGLLKRTSSRSYYNGSLTCSLKRTFIVLQKKYYEFQPFHPKIPILIIPNPKTQSKRCLQVIYISKHLNMHKFWDYKFNSTKIINSPKLSQLSTTTTNLITIHQIMIPNASIHQQLI
jgi:hypothetical protein